MKEKSVPRAAVFGMKDSRSPVIWMHMEHERAAGLAERIADTPVTVIAVEGIDWSSDLTPWPAASIFREQPDFGGGGEAYLKQLTEEIVLKTEAEHGLAPCERWIGGYSLAGMFALWAALWSPLFSGVMSASGSLWYDGFVPYVRRSDRVPEIVCCSLGDRERHGRNKAFSSIEDCTRKVVEILASKGAKVDFAMEAGGHFDDPEGRMERGIRRMLAIRSNYLENRKLFV